jgi:hypothetical protein
MKWVGHAVRMEEMRKKILVEKLNGRNHLGEQEKNRM